MLPKVRAAAICIPILLIFSLGIPVCQAQSTPNSVLLELFTSEGCSSCPPADVLLQKLDQQQPFHDTNLVVLSEHVDYWNRGGWVDPYSSSSFSRRQQHYAELMHVDEVYTPQLIVDGLKQLVGSDWPKVKGAIEDVRKNRKFPVVLHVAGAVPTQVLTTTIQPDAKLLDGDVYLALAAETVYTQVQGGENSGRQLSHTAVAYSITKIGSTSKKLAFQRTLTLPERPRWGAASRAIVFVRNSATGQVLGVSQVKF